MEFTTLQTRNGPLRGHRTREGCAFLGIPYAAPPVGALRWRPPQPLSRWNGVRDALAFGPDVPQAAGAATRAPSRGEDSLHLNVWTPQCDPAARLPVLVWVFGGGFTSGSGSDPACDGAKLAAEGAVVVTLNYRCGLFGFLAHPALSRESEAGVSGNYGLLDQLAALAWVRQNIGAFGGDPSRITAFGYSAGSASLSLLLASPRARGAFDQAILQSPGAARPLASLEQAEQAGLALGANLDALRALPWQEVLAKTALLNPQVRGLTTARVLRPIRDGWLLPEDERPVFQSGRLHAMPMIVGSNTDEGTLLTQAWPVNTLASYRELVAANFGSAAEEAVVLYPARSDAEVRMAVAALFADTQFNYGTRLLAQGMARVEPRTWKYLFTRRPHHGAEVPYVFGTVRDPAEQELSRFMRRAWVEFAGRGVAPWQPYRVEDDNHLVLDEPVVAGAPWRRAQLDFLERFFARR